MSKIPAEYEPIIARVAEKLARATPGMAEHLPDDDEINKLFEFTPPGAQPGTDRQDAGLDDVAAINALIQRRN
ncbi:MAG: hypothetical protein KME14_26190 [Tildeniella torsiva UHER 1998/13D]|jgi:hypothetical protein|nr:hypothetical protein [Tildeniella torsiva UHER 1998/13D]